ncbi:MAG: HAD-IA family hydrolase, partial [Verrucomicrobiota bacterium]|nr:HAD-IA family hydrolase [Verrucomicrobiota bacterium]
LKRLGLFEKFDHIVCREDALQPKPAPHLYLALVEKFKVRYDETLAIEDSAAGVASARKAGLWCLAVSNESTREHDFSAAHHLIESLASQTLGQIYAGLRMGARGGKP